MSEQDPLLSRNYAHDDSPPTDDRRSTRLRAGIGAVLVLLLVAGVPLLILLGERHGLSGGLPKDPLKAAQRILDTAPVIVRQIVLLTKRFWRLLSSSSSHLTLFDFLGWTY
jgi:hypothetical protein